jgi:hypothetical protein
MRCSGELWPGIDRNQGPYLTGLNAWHEPYGDQRVRNVLTCTPPGDNVRYTTGRAAKFWMMRPILHTLMSDQNERETV